jgi:hypothetical protein
MNLYTILISFEDRTVGIDQFEAETPQKALEEFINKAESLEEYDRKKIFSLIINRSRQGNLKGFWIIDLGTDFSDIPELSSIYGGYIVQTDLMAPKRTN